MSTKSIILEQMVSAANEARRGVMLKFGNVSGRRAIIWNIPKNDKYSVESAFLLEKHAIKVKSFSITNMFTILPYIREQDCEMTAQKIIDNSDVDWINPEFDGCNWHAYISIIWE